MNWALLSFVVLGLTLGAAFYWYERTQPTARVLALVATLAALAALGRIAFAPIPNVKPTTDIVLIAGFALGGAPGFAVGAIAALTSNLFFGQGPWTPWQMVAWGAVGIAGAGLARIDGGRLGRVPLALACGLAGLGFGAVMNVSTWLNFYGAQAGEGGTLWFIFGRALPFDIAHAVGNVVFFLAFGPVLLRAVTRFRSRMQVSWTEVPDPAPPASRSMPGLGPVAVMLAALVVAGGAFALRPAPARAASSVSYLLAAQNRDGGWGAARGQGSSPLHTGWAALGLAAAGRNPLDVHRPGGSTPIDQMRRGIAALAADTGALERTLIVLGAAGVNPRHFGGRDLVGALLSKRRKGGSIGGQVNLTAFGIFALRASGFGVSSSSVARATAWLASQQNPNGGFNFFGRGGGSGIDDTSAALQGLVAGGRRGSAAVRRATAFVVAGQDATGGFPLQPGGPPNAQSSAWAVQGLVAAGRSPDGVRRGGRSPLRYLHSLTGADGSVRYSRVSRQTPVWVTGQALTAFARAPFPLHRVGRTHGGAASRAGSSGAPLAPGTATTATGFRHAQSPGPEATHAARQAPTPAQTQAVVALAQMAIEAVAASIV